MGEATSQACGCTPTSPGFLHALKLAVFSPLPILVGQVKDSVKEMI